MRRDKRLERILRNPHDVSVSELLAVLQDHGVMIRLVSGSSHIVCARDGDVVTIARPHAGRKVREHYVRRTLRTFGIGQESDDDARS